METLLDRGAESDVVEAEAAIDRLAAAPADDGLVIREIWLLRLRALLARAHSDETNYRDYRDRYRAMATTGSSWRTCAKLDPAQAATVVLPIRVGGVVVMDHNPVRR